MSVFESTSKCPACIEKVLGAVSSLPPSSSEAECAFSAAGLFLTKMCSCLSDLLMMSAFFTNTLATWTKISFCQSSIFIFLQFGLGRIKHLRGTGPSQGCRAPMGPHSFCMKFIGHLYLSTVCLINQLIFLSLFLISFPFFSSFFLFFISILSCFWLF